LASFSLLFLFPIQAQDQSLNQYPSGETYFTFLLGSTAEIHQLTKAISIDRVKGDSVWAYANELQLIKFMQRGIDFKVLQHPGINPGAVMRDYTQPLTIWNFYPTYSAYETYMAQFATTYPAICTMETITTLPSGRKLLVVKISDNVNSEETEPEFFYTSSMHGDETTGYIMMMHLIDYLLTNYGTNTEVTELVNNLEIWINPLANPDGTYYGGNNTVSGARRGNANNVDLNRNYPDPEDGPHPDGNAWQPETIAFMNFAGQHHFTVSANFHGGAEVFNYPWDTWATLHADDNWYYYIAREYADTVHLHAPSTYFDDLNNGVTNGYAWYEVDGGRQDYMNYWHHCKESTIEISNTKNPAASMLLTYWDYNWRSLILLMKQARYGIHGVITDQTTGNPVAAKVFIAGHDNNGSEVYSSANLGDYHRPIKAGTYTLTITADCYQQQVISNVVVTDKNTVNQNIHLVPLSTMNPDFTADKTVAGIGETVTFTSTACSNPTGYLWAFEGGTPATSTLQNPSVVYAATGSYDVTLTVTNAGGSQSITKTDYILINPPTYNMSNSTVNACSGIFYDSGGPSSNYANNLNYTMVFNPGSPDNNLQFTFTGFSLEYHSTCNYDYLKIYNGNSTSAPLIGTYCGTTSPGTVTANNTTGSLTFVFKSDYSVTASGWVANFTCIPTSKTLNLTLLLEGLFNGTGMNKAQNASGDQFAGNIADQVTLEMHNAASPYGIVGSPYTLNMTTIGTASLTLPGTFSGSYFLVLKHRNSIETWSASPVSFSNQITSYDFTDAASKTFGNNVKTISGKYLFYSGDVNLDGTIDSNDLGNIDNDSGAFLMGYLPTDLNGDGIIDSNDLGMADNNAGSFITVLQP